ncbi:hypothetical protein RI367_004598 [Sorochytrium milnesiophthora]
MRPQVLLANLTRGLRPARRTAVVASSSAFTLPTTHFRRHLSNPPTDYYAKYAGKLQEKVKKEGAESLDDLKKRIAEQARREEAVRRMKELEERLPQPETKSASNLPPHVKPLDKIVRLEKLQRESGEAVEQLWIEYHKDKYAVSAVIPRSTYLTLHERGQKFPTFLLPVFRPEGVEIFLLQHAGHQTHFTSLLAYQTHGADAPPFLTLTYYTDLIDSHDRVLAHGEVDLDRINVAVARMLTEGMREFYLGGGESPAPERGWMLVQRMHQQPNEFKIDDVIEHARSLIQQTPVPAA